MFIHVQILHVQILISWILFVYFAQNVILILKSIFYFERIFFYIMSISLYFGLPGCGKTTLYSKMALDTSRAIQRDILRAEKGKKKLCPYDVIYGNIPLFNIPHYRVISYDWLGKYDIHDALILIDEASLEADCRNYKSFPKHTKEFMLTHRHSSVDICYFNQRWDGLDLTIRVITDRVYYLYKGVFSGRWFTRMYRVPYGIIIPDPKKDNSEKLGEIVQGYCKPPLLTRLFSPWVYRKRYYPYFDSWDRPYYPPLPEKEYMSERWKKSSPTAEGCGENS